MTSSPLPLATGWHVAGLQFVNPIGTWRLACSHVNYENVQFQPSPARNGYRPPQPTKNVLDESMKTSQAIDTQAQPTAHDQIALQAKQPSVETERRKDYCKKLCMVIARYATDDELSALVQTLESFKNSVLEGRYSPGLNDAAYDLYTNFHLRHLGDAKKVKNSSMIKD